MAKTKHDDYKGFVEKFKPKLTTDDCYTPPEVYETIKNWVNDNIILLDGVEIVRPFWPGGDYENAEYPEGCIVLDNPPFSILAKIRRFYNERGIRYFLFGPSLTLFSAPVSDSETFIVASANIIYHNGAIVRTGFITNCKPGVRIMVAGTLSKLVERVQKTDKPLSPEYQLPDNVCTSARLQKIAERGIDFNIGTNHARFIRGLESMKKAGKSLFGGGYLLSDSAAAEKAAAEKAAAEKAAAEKAAAEKAAAEKAAAEKAAARERIYWLLSETEKQIITALGQAR